MTEPKLPSAPSPAGETAERKYRIQAGPDGAIDKVVDEADLRTEIHRTFCSCDNPETCSNEYLADFDDAFPGEWQEHGGHWDLEDGWVKFTPVPEPVSTEGDRSHSFRGLRCVWCCAPIDTKNPICDGRPALPEPVSTEVLGTCADFPNTPHAKGTCESCDMWTPVAAPIAPAAVSLEKVWRHLVKRMYDECGATKADDFIRRVEAGEHDAPSPWNLAKPSAEGDGCPPHVSQHWNNPETGYAECECCCGWALDYERLRKERDEALATIERLQGCVASLESQNASKAAYIRRPLPAPPSGQGEV